MSKQGSGRARSNERGSQRTYEPPTDKVWFAGRIQIAVSDRVRHEIDPRLFGQFMKRPSRARSALRLWRFPTAASSNPRPNKHCQYVECPERERRLASAPPRLRWPAEFSAARVGQIEQRRTPRDARIPQSSESSND